MRWPLLLVTFAACSYGDNLEHPADAAHADTPVAPPDAPLCDADVTSDEQNCGECGFACAGGEQCNSSECICPANPIPTFLFPTGLEQFIPVGLFTLALAPSISLGGPSVLVNGLVIGFDTGLPLDTDIDLATVQLGSTPFVGSLFGLDLQGIMNMTGFAIDASYLATAGTIRFTKLCDTEIEGTITNATFNGIGGDILTNGGIVDPEGCEVHVNQIVFHLMTTACTPPK